MIKFPPTSDNYMLCNICLISSIYCHVHTGRLTLTDHALFFEALRVVSYDKPKIYDLSDDLKQIIKPELTGPWGTRLFDKAVFYKSISL
jgi:hypothetical protein